MTRLHFLDTNILLYSISRDPAEVSKRDRAIDLLERDDGALSVQVLQEFYVQGDATDTARHGTSSASRGSDRDMDAL